MTYTVSFQLTIMPNSKISCSVNCQSSTGTYYQQIKFPWTKPIIIISGIFDLAYTSQILAILSISTLKHVWYSPKNSKRCMYSLYRLLLALPVVCYLEKIGVSHCWIFAMHLNGLSRTGHLLNSCYFSFYRVL